MVKVSAYIPDAQDIVFVDCPKGEGHEQYGRRPALVMTIREYNKVNGLMIACPITSKIKGHPFEVVLSKDTLKVESAVLVHQVTTMDYKARHVEFVASVDKKDFLQIKDILAAILEIE